MYTFFTFYNILILLSILAIFLSIFVSSWISLFFIVPLAVAVLNRTRCFRVRCRAWSAASAPYTERELINHMGTYVGQAWSFFLQKKMPKKPMFTHNFSSTEPEKGFWKSGTLIKTVAKYYEKRGEAFPSVPSYQNITLGGWIMTQSHGSSGDIGRGSSSCFDQIKYVTFSSADMQTNDYSKIDFSTVKCILYVSFKNMEENFWLKKRKVRNISKWLAMGAYQRVCFVGPKQEVMIRWELPDGKKSTELNNDDYHTDPHCCSRLCLWFQADVCTTSRCPCIENDFMHTSYVRLAEVNRFVPFVLPIFTVFVQDYVNFEIILRDKQAEDVQEMYYYAQDFHKKYGGRTEFRYGGNLYLDVSVPKKHRHKYKISGEYHKGKYQMNNLATASVSFKLKL